LECSWALWKEQNEAFPTVTPSGQTDKWKALEPRVKALMCQHILHVMSFPAQIMMVA
jgi:hypothetical protein